MPTIDDLDFTSLVGGVKAEQCDVNEFKIHTKFCARFDSNLKNEYGSDGIPIVEHNGGLFVAVATKDTFRNASNEDLIPHAESPLWEEYRFEGDPSKAIIEFEGRFAYVKTTNDMSFVELKIKSMNETDVYDSQGGTSNLVVTSSLPLLHSNMRTRTTDGADNFSGAYIGGRYTNGLSSGSITSDIIEYYEYGGRYDFVIEDFHNPADSIIDVVYPTRKEIQIL